MVDYFSASNFLVYLDRGMRHRSTTTSALVVFDLKNAQWMHKTSHDGRMPTPRDKS